VRNGKWEVILLFLEKGEESPYTILLQFVIARSLRRSNRTSGKWEMRGGKREIRSFAFWKWEMGEEKRKIWKRIDPSLIYIIEE